MAFKMIAFTQLGKMGRLGNQLFQYTFLRETALRLGVQFYCPPWKGADIFLLKDQKERSPSLPPVDFIYDKGPYGSLSVDPEALAIRDRTDIRGYFMTEQYFRDKLKIRQWFKFKPEITTPLLDKYRHIDFAQSSAFHIRFGDMIQRPSIHFPPRAYYQDALKRIKHKKNILVFSDNLEKARAFLKGIPENLIYVENAQDYEDLYLITLCHDCICSISSFSWWGAWLNQHPDKIVVCPRERYTIGAPGNNKDFWPEAWLKIPTHRYLWHHYVLKSVLCKWLSLKERIQARMIRALNQLGLRKKLP